MYFSCGFQNTHYTAMVCDNLTNSLISEPPETKLLSYMESILTSSCVYILVRPISYTILFYF